MTNGASSPPTIEYSGAALLALHLAPSLVTYLAATALRPVVVARGFPSDTALTLAFLGVHVPLLVGYLVWWSRRHTGVTSWKPAVPDRRRITWRSGGAIALASIVLALAAALLWGPAGKWLATNVFAWIPASLRPTGHASDPTVARQVMMGALLLKLAVDGVINPLAEELYFRGHLLPAMTRYGRAAPFVNAVLFALAHYWQPWTTPLIAVMMFLPAWAVLRYRSVWISVTVRCSVNIIGALLALAAVWAT